jgi:Uma2 family endonuclease
MTLKTFLDWEERQERPWEFDGFAPVAMVGVTAEHAAIQVKLLSALDRRLSGSPCRVFGSDLKILVAGSVRYPDAFVVCSPVPRGTQIITDPVAVFEILSPSTTNTDRIFKNREYETTPSIRRYVMLEQDSIAATVFAREGERWVGSLLTGTQVLALPEIGVEVPLAEIYAGVDMPGPEAAPTP